MGYTSAEIQEQLPPHKGYKRWVRYRLCFDYLDKPSYRGIWNGATNNFDDMIARVNKNGIVRAYIQAEDKLYRVQTVFECDGHEYVTVKWIGGVSMGTGLNLFKKKDKFVLAPDVLGIAVLTRTHRFAFYVDGSMAQPRPLTEYEKKFKLREFEV